MFENGATPKFHGESMFITWIFCMNFPFNGILRVYHYGTPPFQTQSDHMTSTIASSTSGAGRVVSADHRQRQGSGGHCRVLDATCCFSQHTHRYIYIYIRIYKYMCVYSYKDLIMVLYVCSTLGRRGFARISEPS